MQRTGRQPLELLILQPTSFCNIDCSYCYLPDRSDKGRMSDEVIAASCRRVSEAGLVGESISVLWHAGEPLVLPVAYYENAVRIVAEMLPPGTSIEHHFQTNATLIDDEWSRFFATPGIRVGVSIDGPRGLNDKHRRGRRGEGTYDRAMEGVAKLVCAGIPFHVITVLTRDALHYPDELFDFYAGNGMQHVCFNIEEIEGTNSKSSLSDPRCEALFKRFFARFAARMTEGGTVKTVREIEQAVGLLASRRERTSMSNQQAEPFIIVTVAKNGDLSTFSPELLGMMHERFGDFVFGNVLTDSIDDIAARDKFRTVCEEIASGLEKCQTACSYYDVCGGGAPANKLFETGRFDATETLYCRYCVKLVNDVILSDVGAFVSGVAPNRVGA